MRKQYQQEIKHLLEKQRLENIWNYDHHIRSFAFFYANLHYFGISGTTRTCFRLYQRAKLNQMLAIHDQDSVAAVASIDSSSWSKLQKTLKEPGIIATFHLGSYRLLNQWLMRRGVPFVLLVSQYVFAQQAALFGQIYNRVKPAHGGADFQILVAEDRLILKKLSGLLQKGYYVLIYVDGGTGCLPKPKQKGTSSVSFFGRQISVHHGVAMLSFLTKRPIYPVLIPRTATEIPFLCLADSIFPALYVDRGQYAQRTMQTLFSFVSEHLKNAVWQWENWLTIHELALHDDRAKRAEPLQNAISLDEFLPYSAGNACYLLDVNHLDSYVISRGVYAEFVKTLKSHYI